ncbi:MAG: hypothetical protein QM217_01810, partial [Bacillota bacterium]|nr:hypothetical protein [Bacillota bacterium]
TSNGRLILLPIYSNRVFFLDDNMKSLRSVSGMEGCTHVKGRENATFSIGNIEYQGKLILLPWASNGFIEIDIEDMTADCYDVKMSEKDEVNFYRRTRAYNSLHIESNYFTLSKQLRMLKYETTINSDMNMSYDKNESDGKRIFQYLNKI